MLYKVLVVTAASVIAYLGCNYNIITDIINAVIY